MIMRYFSLCASVIAAFSISALLEERNKFVMEHIQGRIFRVARCNA